MSEESESRDQLIAERDRLRQEIAELRAREAENQSLKEALGNREREIAALLGVSPHPVIARFDRQLRHIYVNAAVGLATGIPGSEYLGKTSREMGLPDSVLQIWEAALVNVFEQGQAQTIELSTIVAGRKWVFQSYIVPEFDTTGSVESVLAITRDVSQQRLAEAELLEHMDILETVHDLGQMLSAELDLQKLVQDMTDAATEISRAEFGAFFYNILNEHGESYMLYTLSGVPPEAFSQFPMPRNTEIFAPTFHGQGTVRIADVHQDPRYGKNAPYYGMPEGHLPVTSYLAVPVVSRSREVLGGLFFGHSQAGIFTQRDERIIEGLAAQVAIAMDNAHLYRQARDQQERLQTTLASIGDAVIATDARGYVSFMNVVAQSLTGWEEREAIGKPLENVFRIVNEFTREPAESPVARVLEEGNIVGLANHTVLLAHDGREIPIDDSGAPIRNAEGELIGVILVFRDITERKRSEKRINLLFELSTAFSEALTPKQIADVMVEQARKALDAVVGTVWQLVEQGTVLEMLNLHGLSQQIADQYRHIPLETPGPLGDAVRDDEIVWMETLEEYIAHYPQYKEAILQNGSRSTICMPLKVDERIIGAFTLSFPFDKPRHPDEEAFFTTLANLCAQSLERARLYEEENQARTLAESLQDTGVALSSLLELPEVFDQILNHIDRIVPHDLADIMLIDGDMAQIVRSRGYTKHGLAKTDQEMQKITVKVAETYYFDWAARHKRPRVVRDARTDPNWVKLQDPDLIRSNIIAPILIDNEIAGFLNVNSLEPNFYNANDADFLQTFANQAAIAIRNAQFHQRAIETAAEDERQRIARDLHDSVNQTLFAANMIAEVLPRLWERQPEKALSQTQMLLQLTRGAAAEMRVLLVELRPERLISTALGDLLTQLSHALPGRTNTDLSLVIRMMNGRNLPPDVQIAFYRIAQESLNNIIKHAGARQARIRLLGTETQVTLIIIDNGKGFNLEAVSTGIGLKSMRERAESIQGVLDMKSKVGWGTRIRLVWNRPLYQGIES